VLDVLVDGGTIVDGSGAGGFAGWVGVIGDRIASIGRSTSPAPQASRTIDAAGLIVAPGFVDVHNHSDLSPLVLPEMPSTIRQGVTTVVVGNCGASPWPLASWDEMVSLAYGSRLERPAWAGWSDYLDAIDAARPAVNVATLVGHGSIRQEVLGSERRPPEADELDWMRGMVREAVAHGAVGISTGLIYVPGSYSGTDEVVALASEAATAGGIYASHIRGEGRDLFKAVDEALAIGEQAGLPVHVSHLKCESARVWGRAGDVLAKIHERGATADQYPYEAWSSSLSSLLPPWASVTSLPELTPTDRARLRTAVEHGEADFQSSVDGVGWERIVLVTAPRDEWRGQDVASIADALGIEPFEAFVELLTDDPDVSCIGHAMHDDDVRAILADPEVFVASDASACSPDGPAGHLPVHPREYGAFPRALARARDEQLLPVEMVVRKMTSLPAARFGLTDRGVLRDWACADLVVFDPGSVRDTATYARPHTFPEGIHAVIVNGVIAWQAGAAKISRAGCAIRRR
jgi:N-acyl-D-aspartate/D-glutamate deacylase